MKIITWVDLQGRYRVTSPAYDSLSRAHGFTQDDVINWVWTNIVESKLYGIDYNHPFFIVEDADQRVRLADCCGTYFRYGVSMLPNQEGRVYTKGSKKGQVILKRDARDGAWEMDIDGRPKMHLPKARGIQMDYIRVVRNEELVKESGSKYRQPPEIEALFERPRQARLQVLRDIPQTFDLTTDTPEQLKAKWPAELPARE